jgi:hypothetical protein
VGRFAVVAFVALVSIVVFAVSRGSSRTPHRAKASQSAGHHKPTVYGVRVQVVDGSIGGSGCPPPKGDSSKLTQEQIDRWMRSCIDYMMKRQRAKKASSG